MRQSSVEHNLDKLINTIGNVENNIKEAISRCLSNSRDDLRAELRDKFGDAIDYAEFGIEYDGSSFSVVITNLNEFVLMHQTDSDAEMVSIHAANLLTQNIIDTINKEGIFGGI